MDAIIVLISGSAAFFDMRSRRIPNWLIAFGLVCGVAINYFHGNGLWLQSVSGFFVGVAVLVLPFAFGWIGAGDVKFFGVVGALLGVAWLPRVFFYSALVAGVIAVGYLAFGLSRFSRLKQFWIEIKTAVLSMGHVLPEPVYARQASSAGSVPWGVAFAAGMIIAYYFDPSGRWAGF